MKLPRAAHNSRAWRIHEIALDFHVEDVWALPTPGGPGDFPRLVELVTAFDPSQSSSRTTRALFEIRRRLGDALGLDSPETGLGTRVPTLRDRLPADLRETSGRLSGAVLPFTPLYVTDDELAAEIANKTVHGVLHFGWVPDDDGDGYRGQLAILVKRNGVFGSAYMAAITPFRYLIVYPQMLRDIGRAWSAGASAAR